MAIRKTLKFKNLQGDWLKQVEMAARNLPLDKAYSLVFLDDYPLHTRSQVGYLRGVVLRVISEETGHEASELYEYFKDKYGDPGLFELEADGSMRMTTKLYSTKKYSQWVDKIIAWAEGEGMAIPKPDNIPADFYLKFLHD